MTGFTTVCSRVVPLPVDNIDTDQIIPARFLKATDKTGLGKVLFCDWRYEDKVQSLDSVDHAIPVADFPLNDPVYEGAQILLAGDNFGCGSSRENAPWALVGWGFRAVVAGSFADIFRNNAFKNGLLPVQVDPAVHGRLLELAAGADGLALTIDLEPQSVQLPDGSTAGFPIDGFAKRCLLQGIDELGYLLSFEQQIEAWEAARGGPADNG